MAIDFSQVKTITIPEGSVTKITDSTGNTLWQGSGWHTIWEGNKTCSIEMIKNDNPVIIGNEDNFAQTAVGTGYTPKIRITFSSYSIHPGVYDTFDNYFYINGKAENYVQSSPITIDKLNNNSNYMTVAGPIAELPNASYKWARASLRKERDEKNNRISFCLQAAQSGLAGGNYLYYLKVEFTITKIEQYY